MSNVVSLKPFAQASIEIVILLLPAVGFLLIYVLAYDAPLSVVPRHLAIVGSGALALLAFRGALQDIRSVFFLNSLVASFYAAWILISVAYYALVLTGLYSWGRIPSWALIEVYAVQWRPLLDALGVPLWGGLFVFFVACLILFFLSRCLLRVGGWPEFFASNLGRPVRFFAFFSCLAVFFFRCYEVVEGGRASTMEPLTLTANPSAGLKLTQSQASEGAKVIDEREAALAAQYKPGNFSHRRNVVLIVGDALRSDRMGVFGHVRETTPNLSRREREGGFAIKAKAHSVCAESYCGLMAIARSKYLHEFSSNSISLAHVLMKHGYDRYLILSGDHTNFYGLADSLGPATIYWDGLHSGGYVNDDWALIERAQRLPMAPDRPVFIQFHLMSTHGLGAKRVEFNRYLPAANFYSGRVLGLPAGELRENARNFYDNGILQFDHVVEKLLESLGDRGYLDDALVVITGDHGELLGEGGNYGHAKSVLQPVLDVPVIVMRFGYDGRSLGGQGVDRRGLAAQVDVAPTILDELDLPVPTGWSGVSLNSNARPGFTYFQQGEYFGLFDQRVVGERWKYWRSIRSGDSGVLVSRAGGEFSPTASVPDALFADWTVRLMSSATAAAGMAVQLDQTVVPGGAPVPN